MLKITDISAQIEDARILKGVNLEVNAGEVHAIMGPNGSGKSTLSKVITGDANYKVTGGSIEFENVDILDMEPEDRALRGIFLAFQYPVEIPGVNNVNFLRMAFNSKRKYLGLDEMDPMEFDEFLDEKLKLVNIKSDFSDRDLNFGFSGGEKKRNEILQMAVLDPKLVILDETDSGLDIDALRDVSEAVNKFKGKDKALILVTHYQRLLNYIQPDFVHVMVDGRVVKSGDKSLALELEEKGYDGLV